MSDARDFTNDLFRGFCALNRVLAAAPHEYECDCCGAMVPRDKIATVIAYGIETAACAGCRGVEE